VPYIQFRLWQGRWQGLESVVDGLRLFTEVLLWRADGVKSRVADEGDAGDHGGEFEDCRHCGVSERCAGWCWCYVSLEEMFVGSDCGLTD
jgi:hypothetical protein